mmetsp:Transcript_15791/g.23007  ORF Transcript_15791/g.23007 Transcript_15791/m.23007 type:complete len:90 (-) Transcript_15791:467-736(-)
MTLFAFLVGLDVRALFYLLLKSVMYHLFIELYLPNIKKILAMPQFGPNHFDHFLNLPAYIIILPGVQKASSLCPEEGIIHIFVSNQAAP